MATKALKITAANFDEQVLRSAVPVLVDFWADWCSPCRMIAPTIDAVATEYEGKAVVGKINIDEEEELARRFGVMSIPTLILFKNGSEEAKLVGVVGKDKIAAMIDAAL